MFISFHFNEVAMVAMVVMVGMVGITMVASYGRAQAGHLSLSLRN
jgi:hypothetical protein